MRREDRETPRPDAATRIVEAVRRLTAVIVEENLGGTLKIQVPARAWLALYESRALHNTLAVIGPGKPATWLQLHLCGAIVVIEPEAE